VRSKATALVNGRIGYTFGNGARLQLDVFNILNTKANQIEYFYTSRLQGEPAAGVEDRHFHPVEPRAFRLTLSKAF
jgi:outer membrane receptor protein involved in Fe transport